MPDWYENANEGAPQGGSDSPNANPYAYVKSYSERDVSAARDARRTDDVRKAEELLKRGGYSEHPADLYERAQRNARIADVKDRLSKISGPPLSSDMLTKQGDYYAHQERVATGATSLANEASSQGFKKEGFYYTGATFPHLAQGGMPVYTDPTNSPNRFGIPTIDEDMPEEVKEQVFRDIRYLCDWYYTHHPVVGTCVMIYATYPFVGLDLQCPDPQVEDEYRQMFFNRLNYEELLPKASIQYWKSAEAPMLGEWDPTYAGWSREKIMDPDDITVVDWPGPDTDRQAYFWTPPMKLRNTLTYANADDPIFEWYLEKFGDEQVLDWMEGKPSELPQEVFSLLQYDRPVNGTRGYPILQRAFDILLKEEKLNQAMTAVADRLYTPFIVAKLGSRDLLQGEYPWIPGDDDLKRMQAHLEMVMTSKHRVMVYHSGIEFENPFANQTIPDLNSDLEAAKNDIMGVFGIPPELILGGNAGTFASGALSAEIMMQRLSSVQRVWSRFWIEDRARRVAEARGYYVVERKGMTYTKPMERVKVQHPDGSEEWVTRRKLMLPSIRYETMDLRDQANTFQQLMNLKKSFNVPISNAYLGQFIDPNLNLETEREAVAEELEADFLMRQSLEQSGIPQDGAGQQGGPPGMGGAPPGMGGGRPGGPGRPGMPPGGPGGAPGMGGGDMPPNGGPGPINPAGDRPPQSDMMRSEMPNPLAASKRADLAENGVLSENEPLHDADNNAFSDNEVPEEISYETAHRTGGAKRGGKTAKYERKILDERVERNGGEDRFSKHAKAFKEGEVETKTLSYAERHKFHHFRLKGKKTGTLYSMNDGYLSGRRVK